MTLPANDAFSLGLAHDDDTVSRRTRSRSLTRSPSPKIPFTSSVKSGSRVERGLARRASNKRGTATMVVPVSGNSYGIANSSGNGSNGHTINGNGHHFSETSSSSPLAEIEERREDSPTPSISPEKKKKAIDWEIPRKALHSSIGFLTLYLYYSGGNPRAVVLTLGTALVTVIAPADALRLRYPAFARLYEKMLGFLMRDSEKHKTNGVIWYIIGVLFVLLCYPQDIAVVSILILSWADTAASTFGRLWGRYTPALPHSLLGLPLAPRKSLAGFIAATITGTLTAITFWAYIAPLAQNPQVTWTLERGVVGYGLPTLQDPLLPYIQTGLQKAGLPVEGFFSGGWIGLGVLGVVAGLVSGVAEALDLGSWDDNLTLPIISGGCIWGFFKLVGYLSSSYPLSV